MVEHDAICSQNMLMKFRSTLTQNLDMKHVNTLHVLFRTLFGPPYQEHTFGISKV